MKHEETPADATDSVIIECDLSDPPQRVWQALTVPDLLAAWLMPNDICPQLGARFTLKERPGSDRDIECEVLEIEPNRLLRYSWCRDDGERNPGGRALDSVVTFELAETATGGTHLRLIHSGFPTSLHGPLALLAGAKRLAGNLYALPPRMALVANSTVPIEMRKAA
jgi:uncharacterized protein YndB with AHSA1/START domain